MPRYKIDVYRQPLWAPAITKDVLFKSIMATNASGSVQGPEVLVQTQNDLVVVECKNKPMDNALYGLYWVEIPHTCEEKENT